MAVKICPECDKENKEDAEVCATCGFDMAGFSTFFRFQKASDKAREKEKAEADKNKPPEPKRKGLSFLGGRK